MFMLMLTIEAASHTKKAVLFISHLAEDARSGSEEI